MKCTLLLLFLLLTSKLSFSQEVKKHSIDNFIFNPAADAKHDLQQAIEHATKSHKKILVVIGGDWSYWSRRANADLIHNDYFKSKYELLLINFSPSNKNAEIRTALKCPTDKGYPVFMVLSQHGEVLNLQECDPLKATKKYYDARLFDEYLKRWAS